MGQSQGRVPGMSRVKGHYALAGKYLFESHYSVQQIYSKSTEGNSSRKKLPLIVSSAEYSAKGWITELDNKSQEPSVAV